MLHKLVELPAKIHKRSRICKASWTINFRWYKAVQLHCAFICPASVPLSLFKQRLETPIAYFNETDWNECLSGKMFYWPWWFAIERLVLCDRLKANPLYFLEKCQGPRAKQSQRCSRNSYSSLPRGGAQNGCSNMNTPRSQWRAWPFKLGVRAELLMRRALQMAARSVPVTSKTMEMTWW